MNYMAIKKEDVIHIAKLADLNLSENEIERYTKDMQEILEFANMINSVNFYKGFYIAKPAFPYLQIVFRPDNRTHICSCLSLHKVALRVRW